MKKCPRGLICIENTPMFLFIVCGILFMYFIYFKQNVVVNNNPSEKIVIKDSNQNVGYGYYNMLNGLLPSWPYNNLQKDVLLNPYSPPLSDERYLMPRFNSIPIQSVPINVSTNVGAVDTNYRQVGIITSSNSKGKVLPLMGRPLFTNRDKWQYYTISDQNNSVKLPISLGGKSCTNEYGTDRLSNGDTVFIEGLNESSTITIYDNDTIRYLPSF
jgi:hypothetical protein